MLNLIMPLLTTQLVDGCPNRLSVVQCYLKNMPATVIILTTVTNKATEHPKRNSIVCVIICFIK